MIIKMLLQEPGGGAAGPSLVPSLTGPETSTVHSSIGGASQVHRTSTPGETGYSGGGKIYFASPYHNKAKSQICLQKCIGGPV